MKKVWQVIFVLMTWAISAKSCYIDALPADYWVDSVYQKLTIAERVGQLIDLRVAPDKANIDELQASFPSTTSAQLRSPEAMPPQAQN
jgi:hypothetical protein